MSIRIDVHHFFHPADGVLAALTRIEETMSQLSDKVDALTADLATLTTVVQSSVSTLDGLAATIADLRNNATVDPATLAKLDAAVSTIDTLKANLADAITRDTTAG